MKSQVPHPKSHLPSLKSRTSGSRLQTLPRARRALLLLLAAALLGVPSPNIARQKKPKKAIKDGDAQKVIAAAPGFGLNKGAVRVIDTSPEGASPVVVTAEVEIAVHFERAGSVKDARAGDRSSRVEAAGGWRAVEFRSGDRAWEEFDYLAGPVGAERVASARAALEGLAAEFEARQRERKAAEDAAKDGAREEAAPRGEAEGDGRPRGGKKTDGEKRREKEAKRREKEARKLAEEAKKLEEEARKIEVRRGPLVMKEFSPMYKSARGVVVVAADFQLAKDARGRWQVVGFRVGDASFTDLARLLAAVDAAKAARARTDLERVRAALEDYRRERGFYVVAEDSVVLLDHLSPRHLKTLIRIDPWHRPYRYAGTRERFALSSDGPDGKPSTPDDVTLAG